MRRWANALATSLVLHELGTGEANQSVFRLMSPSTPAQAGDTASTEAGRNPDGNKCSITIAYANIQICTSC